MGFFSRIFGKDKPDNASSKVKRGVAKAASTSTKSDSTKSEDIPDYKIGVDGDFDESGLAKRVALAFDEDNQLDDIDTLWVAQLSGTVVLKGQVPSQDILDKMVSVARDVDGTDAVDTGQVEVG
ncbi:phospholipid-binding protein [cf. Phormidesmis sp. LEGE 11477]|uniref:phospholipid-binding protein n=1 Tax=cf. Phormidesmis sp. LEGE 11477 TaxID=1828680 RepID=UPI00187FFFE3|nr:phospholipid-binding protein [cf. Phormidesmis sp. LEGE 11477]MBE9063775.1 phospholipid-binding protein [cf. Phormidesmis sp. LEGE 11477]